jgi:hypothetical protein
VTTLHTGAEQTPLTRSIADQLGSTHRILRRKFSTQ